MKSSKISLKIIFSNWDGMCNMYVEKRALTLAEKLVKDFW